MSGKTLCFFSIELISPFAQSLLQSLYSRCARRGIELFVVHGGSLESPNEWEAKRNTLYRWAACGRFDAFLISNIFSFVDANAVAAFMKPFASRPTVTMVEKRPGIPVVQVDNACGFRDLLSHLVAGGKRRSYAVITGPVKNADSIERLDTLREIMDRNGIAIDPANVCYASFSSLSAINAVRFLLDERKASFDTLICFNDAMAIAAMEELKRRGIRIPEDVRVTGFDNIYGSAFTSPPLTTVDYPVRDLGETCVDLVDDLLAGRRVPESTTLKTRFIPRLSSGGRRRFFAPGGSADSRRETREESIISKYLLRDTEERFLIQIGDDLGTLFDLEAISRTLANYSRNIGMETCYVVIYVDKTMKRARLLARIEDGVERSAAEFGEFDPRELLPSGLLEARPSLVMEALYAREEDLGYILFNLGDRRGIFFKNLRLQISLAVKGAQLVSTVNRYSEGLERMVRERTAKLAELNEELTQEIRRRESAEKELLKRKNLESLGLLAGGIAHDFNNILTVISGNLSMLTLGDEDSAGRRILYAGMLKALESAKNLTHQLLAFSKGGAPIKKAVSIVPFVQETAGFLLRGSNVKPEFSFAPNVGNAEIDAGQIGHVINNIVLNAVQAMPDGGTIVFGVDAVHTRPGDHPGIPPGRYVKISIEDSGPGIPPGIMDKVFDPYFTTKEKGSGLGLSTSLAIVRKHGGDITVSSTVGAGAVFDVYLPASDREAEEAAEETAVEVPSGLRILVLEDDPQVCQVLSAFLSKTGQESTVTGEGSQAVESYAAALESGKRFDLVLMDLTIPGGMGGREAMARVLELDPDARGIVSSGYSDVPVLADSRRYGFRAILKKPFTLQDFKRAVREALDL